MFNYTKETILNDLSKIIVVDDRTTPTNGLKLNDFFIKRAGNYDLSKIVDLKIYKTKGVSGAKAKVTLTVSTALTEGKTYRFSMFVSTPNKELADYAYPNWGEFGKAVLVEFAGKGTVNDDAAALANALKLSLQPDNALFTVTVSGAVVTLEMAESWIHVAEAHFDEYDALTDCFVASSNLTIDTTTYPNVEEFGTGKWIVENLRFPSYPNVRYAKLYADESPVEGVVYNQYAFEYCVKRSVPGGVSGVGQVVDSITTHVIYVPASLCDDTTGAVTAGTDKFEKLIAKAVGTSATVAAGTHDNEQVITLVV